MNAAAVHNQVYTRAHTAKFLSDKMRVLLTRLLLHVGLSPTQLIDQWSQWIERATRAWLESGHLELIVIEMFRPNTSVVLAKWEFPIRYDGSGDPDMWFDETYLVETFAKAKSPPAGCTYRVVLYPSAGEPPVQGVGTIPAFSAAGLTGRDAGTVIVTQDLRATARYYT